MLKASRTKVHKPRPWYLGGFCSAGSAWHSASMLRKLGEATLSEKRTHRSVYGASHPCFTSRPKRFSAVPPGLGLGPPSLGTHSSEETQNPEGKEKRKISCLNPLPPACCGNIPMEYGDKERELPSQEGGPFI